MRRFEEFAAVVIVVILAGCASGPAPRRAVSPPPPSADDGSGEWTQPRDERRFAKWPGVQESSQTAIDTHLAAGDRRFDEQDYASAIDAYSLALTLDSGLAYAYCNRGSAKRRLGDYDGAIRDLTRAVRIRDDYALAYNNRGFARMRNGDPEGAVEDFTRALSLGDSSFPSYSVGMTYRNRAKAYRILGKISEAEADEDTARNWKRRSKVR